MDLTKVEWGPECPRSNQIEGNGSYHAQAPAVLDHSRTVPQGYGNARPALAGGTEGGESQLVILKPAIARQCYRR
jgi:hypothetical protein